MVSRVRCIAKEKATITVDHEKLTRVRAMVGAPSASAVTDVALSELVHRRRLREDLKAYTAAPTTVAEAALALVAPDWADLADETDWNVEWPESR